MLNKKRDINLNYGSFALKGTFGRKAGRGGIWARHVAEFIGTYIITFVFTCCDQVGTNMWNCTAIAGAAMALTYALGPISGGHFNPATSLAYGFTGSLQWPEVLSYACVQLSAGICAVLSCYALFNPVVLQPQKPYGFTQAAVVESIFTGMLCLVQLNCNASMRNNSPDDENHFFGLAVGFVYIAGGYPARKISGGVFNLATSIGLLVVMGGTSQDFFHSGFLFAASQALGAFVAAMLFPMLRPEEFFTRESALSEDFRSSGGSRLVAETTGTFLITLVVGLNLAVQSGAEPWSTGACVLALTYSFWDISGAHFNPAVTLAMWLSGRDAMRTDTPKVAFTGYIFFQFLAGLFAGLVVAEITLVGADDAYKSAKAAATSNNSTDVIDFTMRPNNGHSWAEVAVGEFMFTGIVSFAALSTLTTKRPMSFSRNRLDFALAISGAMIAGGLALTAISGGYLNPAISAGSWANSVWMKLRKKGLLNSFMSAVRQGKSFTTIDKDASKNASEVLSSMVEELHNALAFIGSEAAGGILAVILFFLLRPVEYTSRSCLTDSSHHRHTIQEQRRQDAEALERMQNGDSSPSQGAAASVSGVVGSILIQGGTPESSPRSSRLFDDDEESINVDDSKASACVIL